jgi:hypothetical protein
VLTHVLPRPLQNELVDALECLSAFALLSGMSHEAKANCKLVVLPQRVQNLY